MRHFKKLLVADRAIELATAVVGARELATDDVLRRLLVTSAVDISTGIILAMEAEGQAEFSEEIDRAVGVACRLECQLLIARDISLINAHTFAALEARTQEVQKMLVALRASAHRGAAGPARRPVRVKRL